MAVKFSYSFSYFCSMLTEGEKRRALLLLFFALITVLIGFGIIIPLLPFYAKKFQASNVEIGFLYASFSIAQIIGAPIWGQLADRYGRKPLFLLSLVGTCLGYLLLANASHLWMVFLSRLIDGFAGGNVTIARAYVADILPPKERSKGYGLIGAAFGIGFILGPALASLTIPYGSPYPAYVASLLVLLALLLVLFLLPEPASRVNVPFTQPFSLILHYLKQKPVNHLLLLNFLTQFVFSIFQTTFPLYLHYRFQFHESQIGWTLVYVGLLGALVQGGLVRVIAKRFPTHLILKTGFGISTISTFILALTEEPIGLYLSLTLLAIGNGLITPFLFSLLSEKVTQDEQGRINGVSSSLESMARILGPIWGNTLLGKTGTFTYLSASLIFSSLLIWLMRSGPKW